MLRNKYKYNSKNWIYNDGKVDLLTELINEHDNHKPFFNRSISVPAEVPTASLPSS